MDKLIAKRCIQREEHIECIIHVYPLPLSVKPLDRKRQPINQ